MSLSDGNPGAVGRFRIACIDDAGNVRHFDRRFDLRLIDFTLREEQGSDADGVYEFGEIVRVTGLVFANVGGMPTPPHQRIRLALWDGEWVAPMGESLYLTQSLMPGEQTEVDGELRFRIRPPTSAVVGAPRVEREPVRPSATQLGEERHDHAAFTRHYQGVTFTQELVARYPVCNDDGIVALRSLAPGEGTRLRLNLKNISDRPIGRASERPRRVLVQLHWVSGEIGPRDLVLRSMDGARVPLDGARQGLAGYVVEVDELAAGGTFTFEAVLGLRPDAVLYKSATLHATIHLSEAVTGKLIAVQHRALTLRVEPSFSFDLDAELVFVTQNATTREAYLSWRVLAESMLGLRADFWSISRYGHFDMKKPLDDGTNLRAHIEDKVVVVLNQPFNPKGTEDTDLPTEYLLGRDFREGATAFNAHTLVIGSPENFALRQFLEPTEAEGASGDVFPDAASFLRVAAAEGGALAEETFKDDITQHVDQVPLVRWTWPWRRPTTVHLHAAALDLNRRLAHVQPNRRYVVVRPDHLEEPWRVGRTWFGFPRWHLGMAQVRRTLNRETSSAIVLTVDPAALEGHRFILSEQTRFAVLLALSFEVKLERLHRLVHRDDVLEDEDVVTLGLLVKALVVDLTEEQAALRSGRGALDETVCRDRLSNLERLCRFPLEPALAITSKTWRFLAELLGTLEFLARSQKRWWMLWGRNRTASRFMLARVASLTSDWFSGQLANSVGEPTVLPGEVNAAMADVQERLNNASHARREALRNGDIEVSFAAAALHVLQVPDGVGFGALRRDIDVWTDPMDRVWTSSELQRAVDAESARAAKRSMLAAANVEARGALLVRHFGEQQAVQALSEQEDATG